MNYENKAKPGGRHTVTVCLITVMVLSLLISTMAESVWAAGFSGKVGSKYTVTSGGTITYGSGEGGYSNSRSLTWILRAPKVLLLLSKISDIRGLSFSSSSWTRVFSGDRIEWW